MWDYYRELIITLKLDKTTNLSLEFIKMRQKIFKTKLSGSTKNTKSNGTYLRDDPQTMENNHFVVLGTHFLGNSKNLD